jgi:hypothetical protein
MRAASSASSLSQEKDPKVISINLNDLHNANYNKENQSSKIKISSLLGTESDYTNELLKLLEKSKGTPYEASLKKFIATKNSIPNPLLHEDVQSQNDNSEHVEQAYNKVYIHQVQKVNELARPIQKPDVQVYKMFVPMYTLL